MDILLCITFMNTLVTLRIVVIEATTAEKIYDAEATDNDVSMDDNVVEIVSAKTSRAKEKQKAYADDDDE